MIYTFPCMRVLPNSFYTLRHLIHLCPLKMILCFLYLSEVACCCIERKWFETFYCISIHFVCTHVWLYMCHSMGMRVRGKCVGISSLLLPCVSRHWIQGWQQVPLTAKPSWWPRWVILSIDYISWNLTEFILAVGFPTRKTLSSEQG